MGTFDAYLPLNEVKPFDQDIWIVDGPEIAMDFPLGLKVAFPTRMVIVRLSDGRLWLHSPIAPDNRLVEQLCAMGEIAFIVAPNSIHYWYLPEWHRLFPQAQCHMAPGVLQRASSRKAMPPALLLEDTAPCGWAAELDQVVVKGPVVSEAIFHHRASRTVILVDLIENFEPQRINSWFWRIGGRIAGVIDPDGKAPADYRCTLRKHKAHVRQQLVQVVAWQPERAIMAHGRPYDKNATTELMRSFRWALDPQPAH